MMFYKFFCIFNRKAKISKKLIFDKPEVPMTVLVQFTIIMLSETFFSVLSLVSTMILSLMTLSLLTLHIKASVQKLKT